MHSPEEIKKYLEQILYLESFIWHQNMNKKAVKEVRKSLKKEIKHIENQNYEKCKIISPIVLEEYTDA